MNLGQRQTDRPRKVIWNTEVRSRSTSIQILALEQSSTIELWGKDGFFYKWCRVLFDISMENIKTVPLHSIKDKVQMDCKLKDKNVKF